MLPSDEQFTRAMACHQEGKLQEAAVLCRQFLESQPQHAAAHHLLGVLAHQAGHHEAAIAWIRKAIELNPANNDCYFNLGIVLMHLGRMNEAIASYREAIRLHPGHAQAHTNLGTALKSLGFPQEALACYRTAVRINPISAIACYNLATALEELGQMDEAEQAYRQAIANNPNHGDSQNNLGIVLLKQGRAADAAECYRQVLRMNPKAAEAHFALGTALSLQGAAEQAVACFREAIRLDPVHAEAHHSLGVALQKQRLPDEAADSFTRALALNPGHAGAHNNLGLVHVDQGRLHEAVACYRRALDIQPNFVDAHINLSVALTRLGAVEEAWQHIDQALALEPKHGIGIWQRSHLRLLTGDLEGGWQDAEQRWAPPNKPSPYAGRPRWEGSPLQGKSILVYAEQGLGDTIQFLRFLPVVKERGGQVVFECQANLARLCADIAGVDQLVQRGDAIPPCDLAIPLLSLPNIFHTNLLTIPATVPYIQADNNLVEKWRAELTGIVGFKVGIAWQGSRVHPGDRYRSVALTHFEALAQVDGVRLISLQKGPGSEQLQRCSGQMDVIDLGDRLDAAGAFLDTSAIMMNLDLVIAVDSAVAHLAGALGVPVWVPLSFAPDWRWLLGRTDSPWYPSMRLFRQNQFGDWTEVFARLGAELRLLIKPLGG